MAKSNNTERETRILDAAAELFVYYGYDKTTVSEIARTAGVSQGGIYLHFESKEDLLEQLILREMQVYAKSWLQRVDEDPDGGTIGGMYKNMLYALNSSPFMAAMFKKDGRILGNYFRSPSNFGRRNPKTPSTRQEFVIMMQEAGAIRRDVDPKVTAHIMNMLAFGLVAIDEVVDKSEIPPIEDLIEGIADLMERALTPEGEFNRQAGKEIIKRISSAALTRFDEIREDQHQKKESQEESGA